VTVDVTQDGSHDVPASLVLGRGAPNPFRGSTQIGWALPRDQKVTLTVYDVTGRVVRRLVDEVRPAGRHAVTWDGTDGTGRSVASGVYIVRCSTIDRTLVQRIVLVR